ncbi:uncharacterized GPI-anchored protein At4g28100-like [Phoenix dactylifera]|uniref:Uncharacterized GPI-anchored protein At4g28100-like n=1 Tax=Phoenix dactylifera TaxID=42345 RepID=A0A8B7D0Y6_PHODC|nr:uncharacterized GPI-anchored protein At4g28100-like [Phoenix dactylifera]
MNPVCSFGPPPPPPPPTFEAQESSQENQDQPCIQSKEKQQNKRRKKKMLQIPFLLLLPILFGQVSLLPAVPKLDPDPALIPSSLVLSINSSPTSATVPAFPEQSATAIPCPLDLPPALLHGVSAACSAPENPSLPSRPRCCPALAAWLFSAHSAAGLATGPPPLSSSASTPDLPILPDDSESCAAAAEAALRAQGVVLPRPNDTCDVAYCYCGIRLGPLRCPGSFAASASEGRWVIAREDTARSLERDCALPGLGGCARCLKTLFQLRSEEEEGGGNVTGPGLREGKERDRECQLMGLTWLLAKDRTRYLRTAAFVLRAFMMSPDEDPTSCSLPGSGGDDDVPLYVDFALVDGDGSSSAIRSPLPPLSFLLGLFSLLLSLFYCR